jgi:Uma2 family endonuclease
VIVTHARDHILTPAKLVGTPDLVVEILSPTSPGHDRERKRHLYETAEVPEYWIVDAERRSVLQLVLVNGHYTEQECREHFRMAIPPHVNLDLSSVW